MKVNLEYNTDIYNGHAIYNMFIEGISRACLQELVRHEFFLTVKSTRYTLKELKREPSFINDDGTLDSERASKYLVWTEVQDVDDTTIRHLDDLRKLILKNISNDKAKYAIPENYKTSLMMSTDIRQLQNFLSLRTNKSALWEIRILARKIFDAIPDNHKFLFRENLYHEKD